MQLGSVPAHCISGHDSGFSCLQGFSLPAESGEASINRRRIPVLLHAASVILTGPSRGSVLSHPPCSGGLPPHAFSPAPPPPFLGSARRLRSCPLGLLLPPDLLRWLDQPHLKAGVSLSLVSSDLSFWFDASDVGWGAHLAEEVACGLPRRSNSPSTLESSWPWRGASSTFSLSLLVPWCPSSWTTQRQWPTCTNKGEHVSRPSAPLRSRFSIGRSLSIL